MSALTVVEVPPVDRTGWVAGPWDDEADAYDWTAHGLDCNIVRNRYGALCGYVVVPETHPDHGVSYMELSYKVHGSLTYSGVVDHGVYQRPWSVGFDCGHAGDLSPFDTRDPFPMSDRHYWTVSEVVAETEQLAAQFADGESRRGDYEHASVDDLADSFERAFQFLDYIATRGVQS